MWSVTLSSRSYLFRGHWVGETSIHFLVILIFLIFPTFLLFRIGEGIFIFALSFHFLGFCHFLCYCVNVWVDVSPGISWQILEEWRWSCFNYISFWIHLLISTAHLLKKWIKKEVIEKFLIKYLIIKWFTCTLNESTLLRICLK